MELKYIRASFVKRFLGYIPDMLVFDVSILFLLYNIIGLKLEYFPITVNFSVMQMPISFYPAQLALEYSIGVFIWSFVWIKFQGKSIGMYLLKTRLLTYPSFDNISIKQAIIRYFAMDFYLIGTFILITDVATRVYIKHFEIIPLLLEVGTLILLILPLYIKNKRPWHDIIAGTCVIDEKKVKEQEIKR